MPDRTEGWAVASAAAGLIIPYPESGGIAALIVMDVVLDWNDGQPPSN